MQKSTGIESKSAEISIGISNELEYDDVCLVDYIHYQKLNGYNVKYLLSGNCFKSAFAFIFRSAHVWMVPVLPVLILQSVLLILMDDYVIVPVFIIFVLVIACVLKMFELKAFLRRYNNVIDNVSFWMHPDSLYYLNECDFETNDELVAGILNDSVAAIKRFLTDLRINQVYHDSFIGIKSDDAEVPNDVVLSILEFLCHYNAIDEYLLKAEQVAGDGIFDVQAINDKVNGLIFQIQKMIGNVSVRDESMVM